MTVFGESSSVRSWQGTMMMPSVLRPAAGRARDRAARPRRVLDALLGVRLIHKILIANGVIIGLCVFGSALIAGSSSPEVATGLIGLAGLLGIGVSVAANALLIRMALDPLDRLAGAAARVCDGDLAVRAPLSPLADPDLARLITTFNNTLDELIQSRARLRTLAARALDTAEDERKRVARELHDDTAQTLVGLLVRLRAVRDTSEDRDRTKLLDDLRDELADAIDRTRRFAEGLRPPALDVLGLSAAIEGHARRLGELEGIEIDVEAEPLDGLLTEHAELALYRIVQEALLNVVRHARASRVRVAVQRDVTWIVAIVEDDGRGFDPAAIATVTDRGLGLFGMEERATYIGGRFEIRSVAGEGTRVRIEIPVAVSDTEVHHV